MVSYVLENYDGLSKQNIIAWKVWYTDGDVRSSLDTNLRSLPDKEVQVVQFYFHHPKGYLRPDGQKRVYRLTFTGYDLYEMGVGNKILTGDWTNLENHDKITTLAKNDWIG